MAVGPRSQDHRLYACKRQCMQVAAGIGGTAQPAPCTVTPQAFACLTVAAHADLETLQGILSVLAGLECTVIWSMKAAEQQLLADTGIRLPAHVHARAWVPQNDLLGAPNMRAFVTQGGANSISGMPACLDACQHSDAFLPS